MCNLTNDRSMFSVEANLSAGLVTPAINSRTNHSFLSTLKQRQIFVISKFTWELTKPALATTKPAPFCAHQTFVKDRRSDSLILPHRRVKMCYPRVSLPHILTLVFLLPHPGALGCDPSFQMSVQDKVMYSKVVAQGTIVKHYPVTTVNPGQFVAELEVQCVFKDSGTRLPGLLNITNGGTCCCFTSQTEIRHLYHEDLLII